jgi:hypothetical protein
MRIWSTSLRSPVTHAARFNAAICRNQHDSGFQLMKIRVTTFSQAFSSPCDLRSQVETISETLTARG